MDVLETAPGPEERDDHKPLLPDRGVRAVLLRQRWMDSQLHGRPGVRNVLSLVLDPLQHTDGANDQEGRQRGHVRSLLLRMAPGDIHGALPRGTGD